MANGRGGLPWWGPARLPFLLLTPACMALVLAGCRLAAQAQGLSLSVVDSVAVMLGALAAHVGVNALNEHHDFQSGLDLRTQRTPFSGGSGALPAHPGLVPLAWRMGTGCLALAGLTGLWLLSRHGAAWPVLLPVGVAGLGLAAAYTPWFTRHPWLCLIAPGLGFGPLMGWGTVSVLVGVQAPTVAWLLPMLSFFLVNNLLLLNQFPDVDADRSVGRRTLPMQWGRRRCAHLIGLQSALAYALLASMVAARMLPVSAMAGLLTLPLAWQVWRGAVAHADAPEALLPTLGRNVVLTLLTPVLVALGVAWPLR